MRGNQRSKLRSRCETSFEVSDTLSELFFKLIAVLVEGEKQIEVKVKPSGVEWSGVEWSEVK